MKVVRGNLLRRSFSLISVTKRPMLRPRPTLGHAGLASLIHTSRLGHHGVLVCVCLLLQYLLQSCSRVCGGEQWRTCATRDYEPKPVCTSLPTTHW